MTIRNHSILIRQSQVWHSEFPATWITAYLLNF